MIKLGVMYVSQETKFYPPTRQFFSFCIEMLGLVKFQAGYDSHR